MTTAPTVALLLLLLAALAPAAAQPQPAPPPCSADPAAPLEKQCGGNGACSSAGADACNKPWTGPSCELLDFLPAAASTACGPACAYHGGENGTDPSWTSWGGQVVQNTKDKMFYMAVSEFANGAFKASFQHVANTHLHHVSPIFAGCNLGTWRCNSQVALARSSTPVRFPSIFSLVSPSCLVSLSLSLSHTHTHTHTHAHSFLVVFCADGAVRQARCGRRSVGPQRCNRCCFRPFFIV